jgi:hypothetical protein
MHGVLHAVELLVFEFFVVALIAFPYLHALCIG